MKSTFLEGNIPILHTIGGRAYPVRHYPIAIRLRTREGYAILCIALNPQSGDFSGAILEVPFKALLHGRLSEFYRWNKARYKRGKKDGNLNKKPFDNTHTFGGRAYPVRHYPIAVRLRDREGRAILCIALNPQSGDFSGAILEVPFKALLHLGLLPERERESTTEGNLNNSTIQQAHR